MDLVLGYNGLQRVLGGAKNHGWHQPKPHNEAMAQYMNTMMSRAPGPGRLFTGDLASQIDWLLPTALIALVVGLALRRKANQADLVRASHIVWGGWLVTGFLLFSFMNHGMHTYYASPSPPLSRRPSPSRCGSCGVSAAAGPAEPVSRR